MCINKAPLLSQLLLPCKRSYNIFYCLSANKKSNIQHMAPPPPPPPAPATWSASPSHRMCTQDKYKRLNYFFLLYPVPVSIWNCLNHMYIFCYSHFPPFNVVRWASSSTPASHFHISKTLPFVEQIIQTSHFRDSSPQVRTRHSHWTLIQYLYHLYLIVYCTHKHLQIIYANISPGMECVLWLVCTSCRLWTSAISAQSQSVLSLRTRGWPL